MIDSRDPAHLVKYVRDRWYQLEIDAYAAGYPIFLTNTYRDDEKQAQLYAQGRTAPGDIVTWIKAGGKHGKTDSAGRPAAKAFDVAFDAPYNTDDQKARNLYNTGKNGQADAEFVRLDQRLQFLDEKVAIGAVRIKYQINDVWPRTLDEPAGMIESLPDLCRAGHCALWGKTGCHLAQRRGLARRAEAACHEGYGKR